MKEINDNEFDKLISESFVRQDILQDIEMSVMKSVKAEARKARWALLLRLAAFCIYYSVALLLPVVATYYILQASNDLYLNGSVVFSMLITFAVIVIRGNKQMKNFSLESL
jgi:hypothetical protein